MIKLLKYLKDYKKETILSPLFKLLEASFELFVPLVIAAIIDKGIATLDKVYILKMCGLLVILALVGLTSSLTAQFYAAKASVGFVTKIRQALFSHIQSFSHTELDQIGTSTLITRMTSDINQVQTGINLTLRLLLRSPFIVFGAMIMAFTVDFKAALVFAAAIPVLLLVVFAIMLVSIPLYKLVQAQLDRVLLKTRENLAGSRVIRAFCKEKEEVRDFNAENSYLAILQRRVGRISALLNPATYAIINAAIIILIWTGAIRVNSGLLTQGEVVALYNYMSQILVELIKLANLVINITKSIAGGNRIQSVLDMKPSIISGDIKPVANSIFSVRFINAGLKYKNAADNALNNITLDVVRGETVGIIGGTGSGKTSLINLIPRFYDVSEGEVQVCGVNVKSLDLDELRQKVSIVPQKAVLFSGTIRDNLLWGNGDASDDELLKAVHCACAGDVLESKAAGLDEIIEQGGKNLSGGQRQRLTIARALVKNAEILILDDSASALDFATDAALRKSIRENFSDMTVFIVSQRASSVMYADKIAVLDDGQIVGIGRHDELLKNCSVYKEIYNSQFANN